MELSENGRRGGEPPVPGATTPDERPPGVWPWADEWVGLGYSPEELGLERIRRPVDRNT